MLSKILYVKGVRKIKKSQQTQLLGGSVCKHNGACVNYGSECDEFECSKPPFDIE